MLNLEKPSAFRRRRRRHRRSLAAPVDVPLTPCRSTNRRPFVGHLIRHPDPTASPLWSAATGTTAAADDEREGENELRELAAADTDREGGVTSVAGYSCDPEAQLLRMGARKWGMSSHGSCAAWSVASLMEKCPASPSPVCSPSAATADGGGRQAGRGQYRACKSPESTHSDDVFYSQVSTELHSSAPRFQSSSDMNARNSTSRLDTGSGRKRRSNARDSGRKSFCVATAPSLRHVKPGRRSGVSAILEREKEANCHMRRSVTLVGAPRFSACSRRSARNNSFSDAEEHRGQLSVLGEEDEEPEERDWRKRNQFMLGSAPAVRRKSHHLCHASVCSPSADCMAQSGFGGDLERNTYSAWEDEGVDAPPPRMSAVVRQTGRAKLLEWKETRTREVLDKLKKKEAEISDWEMRETSKAKKEMKKVEEKMEKKRSTAMENMQRKIMETQRKAEQKKCQARQAAVKKMTEVEKACDKVGTTGRLTWKPLFSF